jgi:hypothetical protein
MVLALALACWYREWVNTHLERGVPGGDGRRGCQHEPRLCAVNDSARPR